jgi:hypothetical protein
MSRFDAQRTCVRIWRGTWSILRDCEKTGASLGVGNVCSIVSMCRDVFACSFNSMLEAVHVSKAEPSIDRRLDQSSRYR